MKVIAMNISLFEEANNALDGGDANKAFHIFMQDAKNGGTDSWNSVGFLYDHGRGVKKNRRLAIQWYRLAAGKGYFVACFNLGLLYKNIGRKRLARFWFKKAYALGDDDAAYELGILYARASSRQMPSRRSIGYFLAALAQGYLTGDQKRVIKQYIDHACWRDKVNKIFTPKAR